MVPHGRGAGLDAVLDLLVGSHCLGCARPGRAWCAHCDGRLVGWPRPVSPDPPPPGLAPCWAAAPYDGVLRELVVAHKEHHVLALASPLGRLLATSVRAAIDRAPIDRPPIDRAPGGTSRVLLVPVPSRSSTVRRRGHDATRRLCAVAGRLLRSGGVDVEVVPLLRLRAGVLDQAGLEASARRANLAGSMTVRGPRLARAGRRREPVTVLICDDVLTTGSTTREAQRALEACGVRVAAVVTVAATRRKFPDRLSPAPPTH